MRNHLLLYSVSLFAFKCCLLSIVSPDKTGFTVSSTSLSFAVCPCYPPSAPLPQNLSLSNFIILGDCLICWNVSVFPSHVKTLFSAPIGLHRCLYCKRWFMQVQVLALFSLPFLPHFLSLTTVSIPVFIIIPLSCQKSNCHCLNCLGRKANNQVNYVSRTLAFTFH